MSKLIFLIIALQSCFAGDHTVSESEPISHASWDVLLKKHVSMNGFVDYGGFKKSEKELDAYLKLIESNAPSKSWSTNEKLAYWINAYNAFTVKLILNHSGENLNSIKDIGSKIKIPFVNTPWDVKFIHIGGQTMDLNNIEHGIIRKHFADPRIHFALVCAAKSCPSLRNEAFVANKLSTQLNDQGFKFVNDSFKNEVSENKASISKIFDWYAGDFKKMDTVLMWLNKYAKVKAKPNASIEFKAYNWELNGKF